MAEAVFLVLIAPNVGEQMGGEAIKALQIFVEMKRLLPDAVQITHGRNRSEIARLGLADVLFVDDDALALFLWRSVVLRALLDVYFSWRAVRLADAVAEARAAGRRVVVHQTEPNSPVAPRALSRQHVNVFGPINGNIYYPALFRADEQLSARLRRWFHLPLQRLSRLRPGGMRRAEQVLVAGGDRTERSLRAAGCTPESMVASLDCGVQARFFERPRVEHQGVNGRYIHFGRLVFHKGTALIIQSLPKTRTDVRLDIVGRGPEKARCQALVDSLGLGHRVRFLDWYTAQDDLFASFADYRGMVLPTIEDANGIVIQEAMALGLPPVCLDWGGPALLIEHGRTGFLVEPRSLDHITTQIAAHLDALATDDQLAEAMSIAARDAARGWAWSALAAQWLAGYPTRRRSQ